MIIRPSFEVSGYKMDTNILPAEPLFRLHEFGELELRLYINRVRSLLSMRCISLRYIFFAEHALHVC